VLAELDDRVRQLADEWQPRLQAISHRLIALVDLCSTTYSVRETLVEDT
jgi:hypothetical protein